MKKAHGSSKSAGGFDVKKDIGLGLAGPGKTCEDKNCPWHGRLAVRGRVFGGVVKSTNPHLTAIVERSYHHLVPKYQRYERRKSSISVHNPACISAKPGDKVVIAECRPLAKTKHFVIVGLEVGEKK
jgi:small subunit ribosomal protein S17